MTTLITGATGAQGGAVARLLLDRGDRVRALTRRPDSPAAERLRAAGAEVVGGDFDDPASLKAAVDGATSVFAVSTPFGTDVETEVRQGIALVDAARDVGHVVFTSAANADRGTGIPHFDSKQRIEEHLRGSGVRWTVLGPAAFVDDKFGEWSLSGLREGVLGLPLPSDLPLHLITVADIAAVAVLALDQPDRFAGVRLDLAGEALTPEGMAEALSAAIGEPIRHRRPPLDVVERYSPDLAAMFRYFTEPGMDVDLPALRAALPEITWHTYAEFVRGLPWDTMLRAAVR
ncbi:NmrA/HSCARG family protein [Umezawaea sp. Da 62-37]|uniref:NmrA/HSCARG family protein n=1 Tax=Umezawaea sp. Da 62-37 TaxID=3075927 RepID=UPI0028F71189|nr:NmrA/HSCARG family protein [Umezawaea sp. Da 62-37]WNV82508.1 NmrA/HSCARG family protein [Umezawaea sp. Da 62-37]